MLLRLGVVVAEQVQDPVHGEQVDLVGGAVLRLAGLPGLLGLPLGHRMAQHEVAEHPLLGVLVDHAGPQLVHREGQHVGGALLLHPLLVELRHGVDVDRLDAELGQRVDPHPVHHEPRERGEVLDVQAGAGLVQDLDAHARPPRASSRASWAS